MKSTGSSLHTQKVQAVEILGTVYYFITKSYMKKNVRERVRKLIELKQFKISTVSDETTISPCVHTNREGGTVGVALKILTVRNISN